MHAIFAQAVGFAAMTLNIGSYQLKNSRQLVLCRAFGDLIYIAHYLLLGAYSGCTTVAICAVNGLIYGCKGQAWAEWKGWKWLLSAVLVTACLFTWQKDFQPIPQRVHAGFDPDQHLGDLVWEGERDPPREAAGGGAGLDHLYGIRGIDPRYIGRARGHGLGGGRAVAIRHKEIGRRDLKRQKTNNKGGARRNGSIRQRQKGAGAPD